MAYRMWKKGRTDDYAFIDKAIEEQFNIGGVDMWLYACTGAKPTSSTGDYTTDPSSSAMDINSISDWVFGDTTNRKYNLEAITFSCVYQVQEATPDMKLPGLFFDFNTMDINVHYNDMMRRLGRKILPGDVLELPNLRDFDVIGKDSGINRFYVVQDAFKTYEGYSATWQAHIWKLRVKPITDSPEYSDILDNTGFADDPDDPNNGNGNDKNSSYQNEMDIMNKIIMQAEDDVPYLNFDNEQFYDPRQDFVDLSKNMLNGYEFPDEPANNMLYLKKSQPILKEKDAQGEWKDVPAQYGSEFPSKPNDGDFFFKETSTDDPGYSLYQYDESRKKWLPCDIEYCKGDDVPKNDDDFYVQYNDPQIYQYKNGEWVISDMIPGKYDFNTSNINDIIDNPQNFRPSIPPQRGSVGEGTSFPSDPDDGEYFYRTDYNPVTCWQYNASTNSWTVFDYGNRKPWLGADPELVDFVNSPDRMPLHDIAATPKYRKDTK